ncbi:hypothetical protein JCM10449v2_006529 [Rhodotorula kratochvilovae]
MTESEQLLDCVKHIYSWLISFHSPFPSNQADARQQLRDSHTVFTLTWGELLPSEREGVVHHLLAAYCTTCVAGVVDISPVIYLSLCERVCLRHGQSQPHVDAHRRIEDTVERVADIFYAEMGRNGLTRQERKARSDAATRWVQSFLGPPGVTVNKVRRMQLLAIMSLEESLGRLLEQLTVQERAGEQPPSRGLDLLPSADTALSHAQLSGESPQHRFGTFHNLLLHFIQLYSASNLFHNGSGQFQAQQAALMATASRSTKSEVALQHFSSLSVQQQHIVVTHARMGLYACCREFDMTRNLPDAVRVLALPGTAAAASPTSSEPALTVNSLAHISDRKARRYYGTTTRAWMAGRERSVL